MCYERKLKIKRKFFMHCDSKGLVVKLLVVYTVSLVIVCLLSVLLS